jgi:hypothetical protein
MSDAEKIYRNGHKPVAIPFLLNSPNETRQFSV